MILKKREWNCEAAAKRRVPRASPARSGAKSDAGASDKGSAAPRRASVLLKGLKKRFSTRLLNPRVGEKKRAAKESAVKKRAVKILHEHTHTHTQQRVNKCHGEHFALWAKTERRDLVEMLKIDL